MTGFPTRGPAELEDRPPDRQWLVEGLWGRQAVGIVGGEPKCGKSFLAPGIAVIDAPVPRLDHAADRKRPVETVGRHRPRLLLLDPLVRPHGVAGNAVSGIAPILGFLRDARRRSGAAVPLVHHARKSAASRPGQAPPGSSELHAWGDSNLYLRRRDGKTVMTAGHRAAPGLADVAIELADDGRGPALRLRQQDPDDSGPERPTPEERVARALADSGAPLTQVQIRKRVPVAFDADPVGDRAADRLVSEDRRARRMRPPDGHEDWNAVLRACAGAFPSRQP